MTKLAAITDKELEQARRRGLQSRVSEAHAIDATYNASTRELVLTLRGGLRVTIPIHLLQGVANADANDVSEVELWSGGRSLHWEKLDADFAVQDIVGGSFGTRAWMQKLEDAGLLDEASVQRRREVDEVLGHSAAALGRKGGVVRSEAKSAASRANGAKGGRPRKTTRVAV